MKKIKNLNLIAITLSSIIFLTSCSDSTLQTKKSGPKPDLDTPRAVKKEISVQKGGVISTTTDKGARINIIFPWGAVDKDVSLVATPLQSTPSDNKNILVKGFSIEESGTGKGLSLKSPVILILSVQGTLPENSSIVRYHENDEGYDVIPTKISTQNGISSMRAMVSHFTTFGGNVVTPDEIVEAKENDEFKDYNWVIYIKDQDQVINGPMKSIVSIDMKAVNTSGDIDGQYVGSATSKTTNEMNSGGSHVSAPFVSTFDHVSFVVKQSDPLPLFNKYGKPIQPSSPPVTYNKYGKPDAPPQYNKYGKPINPPSQDNMPEWTAHDSLTVTSKGVGTVEAGGMVTATALRTQATLPYEIKITGPTVLLTVKMPQGELLFNGYIRGEGKKEEGSDFVPVPLVPDSP